MSVILRVGAVKPNSNQEHQYGSGDEATFSYTDADVLDIPLPEHTYQRPLPPTSTGSQTNTGYSGLPYQDHNYGLPPPPSPPRPPTPRAPTPFEDNSIVQMEEEVKTTPLVSVVEEVVEDSITRCICGYLHDDGYMICCDKCSVWQHIDCMGVDRNNIPDNYFCELCQPRILDAAKAKIIQKRKREELAARNVLSDSSATDTDPEEAANALASMGKKVPSGKKKNPKQKRPKVKEKPPLKLKIRKALAQKVKKPAKKEKENVTLSKPPKKLMKIADGQRVKAEKTKKRLPLTLEHVAGDPWNSNFSPWVDAFDYAKDNHYSSSMKHLCSKSSFVSTQRMEEPCVVPDQLHHSTCVSEVKKNRKGLKAIQEIPAGQAIIEYRGKVMLRHEYDKEHALVNTLKQFQPFVLFYSQLDVDICVDARTYGNEARFVRRSCSPNSEVKHIFWHGKLYFVILSKKQIMCGVEVTIPFDYSYKDCSYCVECACWKNSCAVSKHWKKIKNSQKSSQKEMSSKRKRQSSGSDSNQRSSLEAGCMSPPLMSPSKNSMSPVKPNAASSPLKFPNVSTLLAASALLDEQPDLANQLDLKDSNPLQVCDVSPQTPHHSKELSSRRSSRMSQDSAKDEKSTGGPFSPTKDKANKSKDISAKPKGKEKEKGPALHGPEGKRERRLSSRRQSQDDFEDHADQKSDTLAAHTLATENEESSESQKKMTREERKLDAIMKVFEKMEKREERRKEAMARGDHGSKRSSLDSKIPKKDETGTNQDCDVDTIKEETVEIHEGEKAIEDKAEDTRMNTNEVNVEVKKEKEDTLCKSGSQSAKETPSVSSFTPSSHDTRLGSLDSSAKTTRKFGKRKRRRSRAYSTAVISDIVLGNVKESNCNSLSLSPVSMSTVTSSLSATCSMASEDTDSDVLKFVKTKKHLFDEWSHKHEDETKQEVFVQCLPNPHGNTMDHLQRRNSTSGASCLKGSEAGGGSAKKRWLRQAMHDVPAPIAFNHSLSVSTDSGSASPVHGSSSPVAGACLSSPGAGTALDFVTPLKKRRLIRESINNESSTSPSAGVVAESITPNGGLGTVEIIPKANGIKDVYPVLHHSTDDRVFLHKGCPNKNGISDAVVLAVNNDAITSTAVSSFSPPKMVGTDVSRFSTDSKVEQNVPWKNNFSVIATPAVVPVPVKTYAQPLLATTVPIKFPKLLERQQLHVECGKETLIGRETTAVVSLSKVLQSNSILNRPCAPSPSSPSVSPPLRKDVKDSDGTKTSSTPVLLVNSNTYNSVKSNNLIGKETGENGCVTAKSIMHESSPATVRVDLNAHDMEPPSSISDRGNNVVVNLDDSLLSVNLQGSKALDEGAECQVNSSEDVKLFPSNRKQPLLSVSICDNLHTNFEKVDDPMTFPRTSDFVGESMPSTSSAVVDSSNLSKIDSSCDISESRRATPRQSIVKQANDKCDTEVAIGSRNSTEPDHISSTEAVCVPVVDRVVVELDAPCDSVNNITEDERDEQRSNQVYYADDENSDGRGRKDHEERYTDGKDGFVADSNGEISNCDLAEAHYVKSVGKDSLVNDEGLEMADSVVAESSSTLNSVEAITRLEKNMDSNIDSTCSEAKNQTSSDFITGQDSVCDSNTDSDSAGLIQQMDKHSSVDDSFSENVGVSSSEACASQSQEDSDSENKKTEKQFEDEDIENEAISKNTSVVSTNTTNSLSIPNPQTVVRQSGHMSPGLQQIHMGSGSHSENQACSTQLSQRTTSSSSSTLLASSSVTTATSNILSSEFHEVSTTPTTNLQASKTTSSTSSSSATVKKKVSLLEYRKRLKEKPPLVSESIPTSESTLAPQPSSTLPTHHKLSTTLSLYLSGSSPPRSFSSSLSSTSFSSANSSSKISLSQHEQRKSRMPTLATLPLFKSSVPKKEEKKKPKSKPDKPMSLTDRLRLEFGLEEIDDGPRGKKTEDSEAETSSGADSESIPPPPPPLPVATAFSSSSISGANGRYGQSAPPRSVQTGYVGSSVQTPNGTHVGGFTYQQSVQQQATISSTSVNPNQHISGQVSTSFVNPPPALYKPLLQHNHHHPQQHQQPCSAAMSTSGPGLPHKPAMQQASSSQGMIPSHRLHSSQPHASSNILRNLAHLPLSLNMSHMSQRQQQHHHHPSTSTRHQQNSQLTQDDPPPPPPPLPPSRLKNHNHHSSLPSSASSSSHKYIHQGSNTKSKNSRAAASSSYSSSSTSSAPSSSRYPDNRNRY